METRLLKINLPKWSRMVIIGDKVSSDQAAEIILRTSDLEFMCDDHIWRQQLHRELCILPETTKDHWYSININKLRNIEKSLGIIDLYFLRNYRIASNDIHGWCSWDGIIGGDYIIGKYPNASIIFGEWKDIAINWPFIKLKCQLWNDDDDDENYYPSIPKPGIEFIIENGTVSIIEPKLILEYFHDSSAANIYIPNRERGCTFDMYKKALKITHDSMKDSPILI